MSQIETSKFNSKSKLDRFLDKIIPTPRSLKNPYHRLVFRFKRFVDRVLIALRLKDREKAEQEEFMLGVELLLKEIFEEIKEKMEE